jgi:hypothetical protein
VVLVTIGLVATAGSLVPAGLELVAFYVLLLYPIAWSLVFDARAVNLPGGGRPTRVLTLLVPMAGLLVLATLPAVAGQLEVVSNAALTRVLVLLPFAAVMVLAWWGREQRMPALDAPAPWAARPRHGFLLALRPRRMPRAEVLRWLGLALVTVLCVVVLARLDARSRPPLVGVMPGEIRFGADLEAYEHLVVGPADTFRLGEPFAFIAHLREPAAGPLVVRLEMLEPVVAAQEFAWAIGPGETWIAVSPQPSLSTATGRFVLSFLEGSVVLASGTFVVTPALPDASAGPSLAP